MQTKCKVTFWQNKTNSPYFCVTKSQRAELSAAKVLNTMNKCFLRYAPVLLVAALCLGTVSCGDDDDVPTPDYSSDSWNSSSSSSSPSDMLPGRWEGTGINDDGNNCSMTLTLNPDGTGSVMASCKTRLMVRTITSYKYESSGTLQMNTNKGESFRPYISNLTATSMRLSLSDGPDDVQTTYSLTKTEDYSGGGDNGGSGEADIEEAYTFVVRWNKSTGNYTSSSETYYKKLSSTGKYTLYRHSNGTGEIGIASSNSLSTWGGYRVSSYDYVYRDVSLNSSTYYFFD